MNRFTFSSILIIVGAFIVSSQAYIRRPSWEKFHHGLKHGMNQEDHLSHPHHSSSSHSHSRNEYHHGIHHHHSLPYHHDFRHHHHDEACDGIEDIDMSDLKLDSTQFFNKHKHSSNDINHSDEKDSEEFEMSDITSDIRETGMGSVFKVMTLPKSNDTSNHKNKIYFKALKSTSASGSFTTSVSGSLNSTLDVGSTGKAMFAASVDMFAENPTPIPHEEMLGEAFVEANSSTKWATVHTHRHEYKVLESVASSSTNINLKAENSNVEANMNSSNLIKSGTAILSPKCFLTRMDASFNVLVSANVQTKESSGDINGNGRGSVVTRVIYANKNGTSATWSFANLNFKTSMNFKVEGRTFHGKQYINVKSFTETITQPEITGANENIKMRINNEIKLRVSSKTILQDGIMLWAKGGQVIFRSNEVSIPKDHHAVSDEANESTDESSHAKKFALDSTKALLRKHTAEILSNPAFIQTVLASTM